MEHRILLSKNDEMSRNYNMQVLIKKKCDTIMVSHFLIGGVYEKQKVR